ncbi:SDR family oxidoreductase [Sphingomonas naphthae]|uniref:SDR family oxidoreductase n=1 Tax=Sphingomonas naphthae TaxID=1813468 RepID=A0ABY7THE4_9SPHN|nr:SDR family oxidoreductase [Sphingomonas naphthae]WCT72633.1 SDR family oxidoreductase [Sphingomonas naphthae]
MIVVTGASGQLGRGVISALVKKAPLSGIVASSRDTGKICDLADLGLTIRRADFDEPHSLNAAFVDAEQVLLVSADKLGDEAVRLHRNAIEAARALGVGRLLYTSHMGARHGSAFAPADQHARTEDDLAASGLPFTSLRHGFYAESCLQMVGEGLKSGELRVPADGPVSWTARADLAEADAYTLLNEGSRQGVTDPMTGSDALTMAEVAAIASEITGREVRHITVTDDEWCDDRVLSGMPRMYANMLLGMFRAARNGDFARVDPILERILRRRPRSLYDILKEALSPSTDARPNSHR